MKKPYTWQEWKDEKLIELQLQGINPFFEVDIGDLPADDANIYDTYPAQHRKVYGNLIDGVPGYELTPDGKLRSKEGTGYTATQHRAKLHNVYGNTLALEDHAQIRDGVRTGATHLHDQTYTPEKATLTLAGGALANEQILAAHGSGSYSVVWAALSWDTVPAVEYLVTFHDAGGGNDAQVSWGPGTAGQKHLVYGDFAATTALQVDVTGGAGVESLQLIFNYCSY